MFFKKRRGGVYHEVKTVRAAIEVSIHSTGDDVGKGPGEWWSRQPGGIKRKREVLY